LKKAVICIVIYRKLQYFLCLKGGAKISGIFGVKQEIFYGQFNRTVFKPPFLDTKSLLIRRHLKGSKLSLGRWQTAFRKSYVIVCNVFTELDEFKFTFNVSHHVVFLKFMQDTNCSQTQQFYYIITFKTLNVII
jgi:hypothetical protein